MNKGRIKKTASIVIWVFGLFLVVITVIPLADVNEWWIRIFDFPRIQIAVALAGVILVSLLILPKTGKYWFLLAFLTVCLIYHLYRVHVYLPLHPVQMVATASCPSEHRISLLVANVEASNRSYKPMLVLIENHKPDMILAIEANEWWQQKLEPVLADEYPYYIKHTGKGPWSIVLFSRLRLIDPEVRFLLYDHVPSIRTSVALRSGNEVLFYGLHPKPPEIGTDTDRRDAELLITAYEIRDEELTAIVTGDMNDVAWSDTTALFRKIGNLLDPRIGRGIYPTFNAQIPLVRWPIDHIFATGQFTLLSLQRSPAMGSDHFPLAAELCFQPSAQERQGTQKAEPDDFERAKNIIEEGRREAKEEKKEHD